MLRNHKVFREATIIRLLRNWTASSLKKYHPSYASQEIFQPRSSSSKASQNSISEHSFISHKPKYTFCLRKTSEIAAGCCAGRRFRNTRYEYLFSFFSSCYATLGTH